jgi:uncharacterized protein YoxC
MTKETTDTINSIRYIVEAIAVAFIIWLATTINELQSKVIVVEERKQIIEIMQKDIEVIKLDIKELLKK